MTLTEVLAQYPDTDKGTLHSYDDVYQRLLAPYREQAVTVLEVGVRRGGSLQAWRDFFPRGRVIGIDDGSEAGIWQSSDPRIDVRVGNSVDVAFTTRVGCEFNGFDIVIDDGNHCPIAQAMTWVTLHQFVRTGGIYIIEDIENIDYANWLRHFLCGEILDRRHVKQRHDDILLVWRPPAGVRVP